MSLKDVQSSSMWRSESVGCSVMSDSVTTWTASSPGSSVHGILQARKLECVAILFSRESSWCRDHLGLSPKLQADSLQSEPPGKSSRWRISPQIPPTFVCPEKEHAAWEKHATVEFPANCRGLQSNEYNSATVYPFSFLLSELPKWCVGGKKKKTWLRQTQEKWGEILFIKWEHIKMCWHKISCLNPIMFISI